MSTENRSNNRGSVAITKNGNTVTINSSVQVLTLKVGKNTGTFAFYTGSGYLYAASSSDNHLKIKSTLDENGSWNITVTTAGVATIKATGSNTRNWLRFNTTNSPKIFSCYGSGQTDISLYVYVEGSDCPPHAHAGGTATCKEEATCTTCGEKYGNLGGHTSSGAATCEVAETCTVCGVQLNAALTHDMADATCTAPKTCQRDGCGHTEGDALGHLYGDWIVTKPATETEEGSHYHVCSSCGDKEVDTIPKLDHVHSYTPEVTTEAGCETLGVITYTCSCGDSYTEEIDALGHTTENGVCGNCGQTIGGEVITPTTVTVSIADYAAANGWGNSTQYTSLTMDSNVTVTVSGGGNTGKYYTNGNDWRIYQTETPKISVTTANGETIVSVKITYTVDKTGVLTLNGSNIASGTTVAVNAASVQFGVSNTGTATNGQVRITAIEVVYSGGKAPCAHTTDETLWGEGEITKVATCTTAGEKTYTCTVEGCGATKTEEIAATGHADANKDHACDNGCDVYQGSHVDANGDTVCDYGCSEKIETETPVEEVTISKTAAEIMGLAGLSTSNGTNVNNKEIALDDNISIICSKAESGTAPSYYSPAIRLYQNGATLTIKGVGMKTIIITVDSSDGDGPISVSGGTASALTSMKYTITVDEGAETVVITTTGTDKNSRVYVSNIEVTYTVAVPSTPEHTHTGEKVDGQAATCVADGWKDYYQCSDENCAKLFSDAECTKEITDLDAWKAGEGKISATGAHVDTNPANHKCDVCGETVSTHTGGEATCTAKAVCEICKQPYGDLADHTPGTAVEEGRVESTCAVEGYYYSVVYCSVCETHEINRTKVDLPLANHSYEPKVTTPTCTAKGYTTHTCACGESYVDTYVDALNHNMGAYVQTKAATCTENGEERRDCSRCDYYETKTVDALDHKWNDGVVTTPATCSAKGVKTFTCQHNSAHTYTEEVDIDATAHNYDEGVVTTPATCSAKGVKTFTCQHNSAHTYTEEVDIDATAHSYDEGAATYSWSSDYKTCTATRICVNNNSHKETATATVTSKTVNATCAADGSTTYTATFTEGWASKQTKTVVIEATVSLKPNDNWKQASARFAAYFFNDNTNTWVNMTDSNGDGTYECVIPSGYEGKYVIFCRMDPSKATNDWTNKWNQTANLTLTATQKVYKIVADTWATGYWDSNDGTIYLDATSWGYSDARYAIWTWNNDNDGVWVNMSDPDKDGVYEIQKSNLKAKLIFVRMNGTKPANNWDNKWNQTGNLTLGSNNYFKPSGWDGSTTTWSKKS